MKISLLLFSVLFILCIKLAEAQITLPDSSHVLVVYNSLDQTSIAIKNYYQQRRGIPESNIVPLDELEDSILINYDGEDHLIVLDQQGEIIKDWNNQNGWCPTKHAWIYFNERMAIPIANHLNNTYVNGVPLKDIIRFIVLCKGIPYRINTKTDDGGSSWNHNVTVDRLLCFLGETIDDPNALLRYYYSSEVFPCSGEGYDIDNPFYNADPNFSMEKVFLPNQYSTYNTYFNENLTLSYLITHLDASSLDIVKNMIDSSIAAINSHNYDWFIDSDPTPCHGSSAILKTSTTINTFNTLGITNYFIDNTEQVYTNYNKPVLSYCSNGVHTSEFPPPYNCNLYFEPDYLQTQLNFTYLAGSVFNTAESFNASSIGTWPVVRRPGNKQGKIHEFMLKGGTVGVGQAYHGTFGGGAEIIDNSIMLPSYAMGYSFIEAAYLGLRRLTDERVVVGDPLTRISYPCEPTVLTTNTTISTGDYDCDIIVPEGITLTIASFSNITFGRNVALIVRGNLNIEEGAIVQFSGFSELRLDETAEVTADPSTLMNFWGNSSFTINNYFLFDGTIHFSFNSAGSLTINGISELTDSYNLILSGNTKCYIAGTLKLNSGTQLTLISSSILTLDGKIMIDANASLNFNGSKTHYNYGTMLFYSGSVLNINQTSNIASYGKVYVNEGVTINDNNSTLSSLKFYAGVFKSIGSFNNPVIINCPLPPQANYILLSNLDTLILSYTTINSGRILFSVSDQVLKPRQYLIANSRINNSTLNSYFGIQSTDNVDIMLSDNIFSITAPNIYGLEFIGFNDVEFLRNSLWYSGSGSSEAGIRIANNVFINIKESDIVGFDDGITQLSHADEMTLVNNENITISKCNITGSNSSGGIGISINNASSHTGDVKIDLNNISYFGSGVFINKFDRYPLYITKNSITNYGQFGISINGSSEAVVKGNNIIANEMASENCIGISVSQLSNPVLLENTITAQNALNPGCGIMLTSADGQIRKNLIRYHRTGIELGSSSPQLGANIITDNDEYGIYISGNSNPDLSEAFVGQEKYPLSGYNTIRENGICNQINYSELYLLNSTVSLEKGCNTVADDREEPLNCGYYYLIDGEGVDEEINAIRNYWGEVNGGNPEGRFGENIPINFDDWLDDPCTYDYGETELILVDSRNQIYDTVYSTGVTASNLTDIESSYATAYEYYCNNQFLEAKLEYEGIIQNYGNYRGSLQAYNRLYSITNLTNSTPEAFNQLRTFYIQKASDQTDSVMIGSLNHLGDLCLVSSKEYLSAINNFDQIAQQNPNTDLAFYRQIDALTTALLLPPDSTMNKGILGKYYINDLNDYKNKLSKLLKTRGRSELESDNELIPNEYTLYQNYPNPFNPITIIKYDLPKASDVSLFIFDILGRKVKELVNTGQQPGRYEVRFNASNFASGVYIYQLITEKYISSKKMILLK